MKKREKLKKKIHFIYIACALIIFVLAIFLAEKMTFHKKVLGASSVSIPGLVSSETDIHLGIPFDGSISTKNLSGMDLVWGTFTGKRNPQVYALGYIPYDRDPTSTPKKDLLWWKSNHPDWIVYQCDRTTPALEFGDYNIPLDITNPLVQAYQMGLVKKILTNNDGIAWDNVDTNNFAKRCGIWKNGQWHQLYTGLVQDTKYQNDVLSWAKIMYQNVKNINSTAGVSMNFSIEPYYSDTAAKFAQIAPFVDIIFNEAGFTNWGNVKQNYITDGAWQEEVKAATTLATMGKGIILNAEEPEQSEQQTSLSERLWVLANYLLVKGPYTYTYISAPSIPQHYGYFVDLPEYHLVVGQPNNPYYADQGIYWREYTHALILVNPSSTVSKTVTFSGQYTDISNNPVANSLTLPAHSGLILLKSPVYDPSDINHDGKIDILDYNILISCYGVKSTTDSCIDINKDHHDKTRGLYADINNDGVVDGIDYNIWLRAFINAETK